MMASIKFDDGKEVTLSKETTERLRKELLHNIPKHLSVGQVFEIDGDKRMIVAIGSEGKGLTSVGLYPGCYTYTLSNGVIGDTRLKEMLIRKNAKYLGRFSEVFKLKS